MAAPYRLMEIQYAQESAFAENAESPGSNTWTKRIPCISYTLTCGQERIRDGGLLSRMSDEELSHRGPRDATLELTCYWSGHQGTTAGALTSTWLQTLLGNGLGGTNVAATGTTVSAASSGSSVTFTATTGWSAGGIGRIGVKGDTRADGQAFVVNSVGTPVTFLTALPGTPSASDVIYATQVAYHDESVAASLNTMRFLVGYATSPTAGAQCMLMGGQLASLKFNLPLAANQLPTVTLTYRFAYWQRSAVTIPSNSLSLESDYVAPCAGGSMFMADFATATRTTITPSEMTFSVDLGLEAVYGPGGNGTYQQIVGWARTKAQPMLTFKVPYTTAWETFFDQSNSSFTYKHCLFTANAIDGRAIGFYLPRAFVVGQRPSQPAESNSQLYTQVTLVGRESTTTSTELTRSAFRIFAG